MFKFFFPTAVYMDGVTGNQRLLAVGSVAPLSVAKGLPDKFSYTFCSII